jgi:signal transduction histidine kinase
MMTEKREQDMPDVLSRNQKLIHDQREANERLLGAALHAQALTEKAEEAQERAEQSERELRAAAELRELFIGVVGHDLRNPLASIMVAAGTLLKRGQLDEQDEQSVARILGSSQRMSRMIARLLDLTRVRLGGGLLLDLKPTDLRRICQTVVEEFKAGAVRLEVDGDLTGTWDEDRLAEMLSNITGNAIEHAAPGTAAVVKAYADGAEVVVEISNHGDPIPADVLPFIFEPFRRARPREKSGAGNLGLGLYIAHQVVLSHGGTLSARSGDRATTLMMRLPRRPPPKRS